MKNEYIIVGDNNYWYSTIDDATPKEAEKELKQVRRDIKAGVYDDGGESANELWLYKVEQIDSINI